MKKKTIFWVLLILGSLFAIDQYSISLKTEQFDTILIAVDTVAIDEINLRHPASDKDLTFNKEEGIWILSNGNNNVKVIPKKMAKLLEQLNKIEVDFIISDRKENWSTYGVAEDYATNIQLFTKGREVENFWFGKIETDSSKQSYVRIHGGEEVYALKNKEGLTIDLDFNAYRNQVLIDFLMDDIIKINFIFPDTIRQAVIQQGRWLLTDGTALDSLKINQYLKNIQHISSPAFINDFDETGTDELRYRSIQLGSADGNTPLIIDCFRDTTRKKRYILHSNYNPKAWFESDSLELYRKIFDRLEKIISQ